MLTKESSLLIVLILICPFRSDSNGLLISDADHPENDEGEKPQHHGPCWELRDKPNLYFQAFGRKYWVALRPHSTVLNPYQPTREFKGFRFHTATEGHDFVPCLVRGSAVANGKSVEVYGNILNGFFSGFALVDGRVHHIRNAGLERTKRDLSFLKSDSYPSFFAVGLRTPEPPPESSDISAAWSPELLMAGRSRQKRQAAAGPTPKAAAAPTPKAAAAPTPKAAAAPTPKAAATPTPKAAAAPTPKAAAAPTPKAAAAPTPKAAAAPTTKAAAAPTPKAAAAPTPKAAAAPTPKAAAAPTPKAVRTPKPAQAPIQKQQKPTMKESDELYAKDCTLDLIADHTFYGDAGYGDVGASRGLMTFFVHEADRLFRLADFDGDGKADMVGFSVLNATVYTDFQLTARYPLHDETLTSSALLSKAGAWLKDPKACYVLLFTYRSLPDNSAGYGYGWNNPISPFNQTGSKSILGGACSANPEQGGQPNVGFVNLNVYGQKLTYGMSIVAVARVLAAAFGGRVDPNGNVCPVPYGTYSVTSSSFPPSKTNLWVNVTASLSDCAVSDMASVLALRSSCLVPVQPERLAAPLTDYDYYDSAGRPWPVEALVAGFGIFWFFGPR